MKVVESNIIKLSVTEIDSLDPVGIYLEQWDSPFHNKAGKITITCFGSSWTASFGGMGVDILNFINSCDSEYLSKKLNGSNRDIEIDRDAIVDTAKVQIFNDRRAGYLQKNEARELYESVEIYLDDDALNALAEGCVPGSKVWSLMSDVFGDEWWLELPTRLTSDYRYLLRVVEAAKQAVKLQLKKDKVK